MRARNTSPALMCRSDAPRSTAALMILSSIGGRVAVGGAPRPRPAAERASSLPLVDEVPQRLAAPVPAPVVEEEVELRGQNRPGDTGDTCGVSSTFGIGHSGLVGRQWLRAEDVQHRAPQPAGRERRASASSSSSAPRATFTTIAPAGSNASRAGVEQPVGLGSARRGQHHDVGAGQRRRRARRPRRRARTPAAADRRPPAHARALGANADSRSADRRADPADPHDQPRHSPSSAAGASGPPGHGAATARGPTRPRAAAPLATSNPRRKCSTPPSTCSAIGRP